jgi:hypothetical protein
VRRQRGYVVVKGSWRSTNSAWELLLIPVWLVLLVLALLDFPPNPLPPMFFGRAARGDPDTAGPAIDGKVDADDRWLALTDYRLLVLSRPQTVPVLGGAAPTGATQTLFGYPRPWVRYASWRPRLVQSGRVRVGFADGSYYTFRTGVFFGGERARRIARALSGTTGQ